MRPQSRIESAAPAAASAGTRLEPVGRVGVAALTVAGRLDSYLRHAHRTAARGVGSWWLMLLIWTAIAPSGIGLRHMWFPDEPDVAEPVVEMLQTHDWVTPRHNHEPWIDYPPMIYWLSTISVAVLGSTHPFVMRLPCALAALLLAFAVWRLGTRFVGARTAWWAAVFLLILPEFAWQSFNLGPDMVFSCALAAGLLLYAQGATPAPRSVGWRHFVAFLLFGVAWLSKGPLGLLLPGLLLVLWHGSLGDWRGLRRLIPLALVSGAVAGAWYVAVASRDGSAWLWREIYQQNFARFRGADRGHLEPWYYYFAHVWFDLAPLAFFLPWALADRFETTWADPLLRLLWLWFVVTFVFFSTAATKRELYLLPAYPAAALLVARYLSSQAEAKARWIERVRGAAGRVLLALAPIACLAPLVLWALHRTLGPRAWSVIRASWLAFPAIGLLAGWAGGAWLRDARATRGHTREWWTPWVVSIAGVLFVVQVSVLPAVDDQKSYQPFATWIDATMAPGVPLALLAPGWSQLKECGFLNYLYGRRELVVLRQLTDATDYWSRHPDGLIVTRDREYLALRDRSNGRPIALKLTWSVGSTTYAVLTAENPATTPGGHRSPGIRRVLAPPAPV